MDRRLRQAVLGLPGPAHCASRTSSRGVLAQPEAGRTRPTSQEEHSRRESEAQAAQVERALEVENERAQDAAVQAYLDQLTQLLVTQSDDALIRMQVDDDVRQVIQARWEPLLRSLSSTRRWSLVRFLGVIGLLARDRPLVSLVGADLRGVDGRDAPLQGVYLQGARMQGANVISADLTYP